MPDPAMSRCLLIGAVASTCAMIGVGASDLVRFEARHTHPLEAGLDGQVLLAVNSDDGRLSVFSTKAAGRDRPVLYAEIPVGLEPVAVRARTADEVWVVNEVSDAVSVVSLSRQAVVATLWCPDEPADVVFARNRAYVSCARSGEVRVFEAETRHPIAVLPMQGLRPRALAVDSLGRRVLVGFLDSGNGTTVIPATTAPSPEAPWNPNLTAAPGTALIVEVTDPRVTYTVLDHDLAVIPTGDLGPIQYFGGLGTSIFTMAARPGTDEVWVGNTEANNRVRYEPRLKSRFVNNRLSQVDLHQGKTKIHVLSPFDDVGEPIQPEGAEGALAQPMALAFSPDGRSAWLAAFASDRIARVNPETGQVEARCDLRKSGESSAEMRGPRGLVLDHGAERLYVLNKLSGTLATLDSRRMQVVSEVGLAGVEPPSSAARRGRGLLFDARLSGNGASSCGSCHIDADVDGLAWDLGDPGGDSKTVIGANLAVHDPIPRDRVMHPMKGPMVTQTLRGLIPGKPLHWRGDRASLQDFNGTFRDLLGGTLREDTEIDELAAYLATLRHHPNPNRSGDDSLPTAFRGGNAARGEKLFAAHLHHCAVCHVLPDGTDGNVDDPRNLRLTQAVQNPALHTTYQRALLNTRPGATNLTGFGLLHDGTGGNQSLPTVHFYDLDALSGEQFKDVEAFVLSFNTGTAPVVGRCLTVTAGNRNRVATSEEMALLESQATKLAVCDLIVRGRWQGKSVHFIFEPTSNRYAAETSRRSWTRAEILSQLRAEDAVTFLAVPVGSGRPLSIDRDANGRPDLDDPFPSLVLRLGASGWMLRRMGDGPGWVFESSTDLAGGWSLLAGESVEVQVPSTSHAVEFFRLRRTW
ncbi:MAG: hypothetical protein JNK85_25510 [Verrucomicrobiales bacterium]|nr:hypothetical protein [Verrucomicrobiales bacterium]